MSVRVQAQSWLLTVYQCSICREGDNAVLRDNRIGHRRQGGHGDGGSSRRSNILPKTDSGADGTLRIWHVRSFMGVY